MSAESNQECGYCRGTGEDPERHLSPAEKAALDAHQIGPGGCPSCNRRLASGRAITWFEEQEKHIPVEHNEKLVEIARSALSNSSCFLTPDGARAVLAAWTDPSLGPDRLVRLGDIVAWFRSPEAEDALDGFELDAANVIERRFSGGGE